MQSEPGYQILWINKIIVIFVNELHELISNNPVSFEN